MRFLVRVVINAIALWLTTLVISGIAITETGDSGQSVIAFLMIGLIFGLVNAIVKPIAKVLSFPILVLTLGLFTLVVNALMLLAASWLTQYTPFALHVDGFWSAFWGAIIISIVSFILSIFVSDDRD